MPLDQDADGLPDQPVALDRTLQVGLPVGELVRGYQAIDREGERLDQEVAHDPLVDEHPARPIEPNPRPAGVRAARHEQQTGRLIGVRPLLVQFPGQASAKRRRQRGQADRTDLGEHLVGRAGDHLDHRPALEDLAEAGDRRAEHLVEVLAGGELAGHQRGRGPALAGGVLAGHVPHGRHLEPRSLSRHLDGRGRHRHPHRRAVSTAVDHLAGHLGMDDAGRLSCVRPPRVRRTQRPFGGCPAEEPGERVVDFQDAARGVGDQHGVLQRGHHRPAPGGVP